MAVTEAPRIVTARMGHDDSYTLARFLATRGYLVLQPNFRGSGGYGVSYAQSGYRKWGGRMEDDITDGVKALVDSGQVDPKRICIFGASYGGYAALIGGAQRPDLYKCVVSWAGMGGDADGPEDLRRLRDRWMHRIGDEHVQLPHAA